jgi:hypothetical protein
MKKLVTLVALLIAFFSFSQVPQGISYQAIALNASGNPIVSSPVGVRLSLLDLSASGTVLYTETHTPTTNAQGLYNLVIGQGTPTLGIFSAIKWETNSKFLKIEMDAAGGTNYVLVGSTQLLSVPYALYAGKVKSEDVVGGADIINVSSSTLNTNSFITNTNAYVYMPSSTSPYQYSWHSTPISGTPFMKSFNSFLTSTNVYIYVGDNWSSYPISGIPKKIISYGLTTLVVTSTNAYLHTTTDQITYNWLPVNIAGDIIAMSNNFGSVGVLTSTNFYIYDKDASGATYSWISTPISGTPLKIKHTFGGIMALTSTNSYLYGPTDFNTNNYGWHNIPISGTLLLD